jgi:glutathione transport system substrate-binding protein
LLKGQAQYTSVLSASDVKTAQSTGHKRGVSVTNLGTGPSMDLLELVEKAYAPFGNPLVREAINYGINRAAIAKVVYGGLATPATLPPSNALAVPGSTAKPVSYNPTKAEALLSQAGYGTSNPLTFTVETDAAFSSDAVGQELGLIQSQLAAIGVKMSYNISETASQLYAATGTFSVEATEYNIGPSFGDAGDYFEQAYNTAIYPYGPGGGSAWSDPAVESLLTQALTATGAKYRSLIASVDDLLATNVPAINIVNLPNLFIAKRGIKGEGNYGLPSSNNYFDELSGP